MRMEDSCENQMEGILAYVQFWWGLAKILLAILVYKIHTQLNIRKTVQMKQGAAGGRVTNPFRRDQKLSPSDVCLVAAWKDVGGRSPVPSGQVFETQSHPCSWHPWWGLHRQARIKSRGDQIALPPGAVAPAGQGWGSVTEPGQPQWKPSLLLLMLCFAEKFQVLVPRAVNPTAFIDTVMFELYFHLATTVSKSQMHLFHYQKNNVINAKF